MTDAKLLRGYVAGRRLPDGRLAAVHQRVFNTVLMVGLTENDYDHHW